MRKPSLPSWQAQRRARSVTPRTMLPPHTSQSDHGLQLHANPTPYLGVWSRWPGCGNSRLRGGCTDLLRKGESPVQEPPTDSGNSGVIKHIRFLHCTGIRADWADLLAFHDATLQWRRRLSREDRKDFDCYLCLLLIAGQNRRTIPRLPLGQSTSDGRPGSHANGLLHAIPRSLSDIGKGPADGEETGI